MKKLQQEASPMNRIYFFALLLACVSYGCSSVRSKAVDLSAGVISDASYEMETESNWENFRQAVPGNLKMIEGLLYVNKKNDTLLATLTKGYGAYAYVVHDTLNLEDMFKSNDSGTHREQALRYYKSSLEYGIKFLKQQGIEYQDLMQGTRKPGAVTEILNDKIDQDKNNIEAIFFLGQSLMGSINLNKNRMGLVAQLPVAKEMIDWACSHDLSIAGGTCKLIEAIYLASRPRAFGGDTEKAKVLFEKFIKDNPNHWFARVAFMQYYYIPMLDEDGFNEQARFMEKAREEYLAQLSEIPDDKKVSPAFQQKNLRIYQALAIKRYEIMKKYKESIF